MKYLPALALLVLVVFAVRGVLSGTPIIGFPALLLLAVIICGIAWAWDKFFLAKKRPAGELAHWGIEVPGSIFWVLFAVFILRSFIAEPFRIPSSSMRPGLVTGDFILVNKFSYGLRWPVLDSKFLPVSTPARGDVAVFKAPHEPDKDFIKRIIGIPGDTVVYDRAKGLSINGKPVEKLDKGTYSWTEGPADFRTTLRFTETIDGRKFDIANVSSDQAYNPAMLRKPVPASEYFAKRESGSEEMFKIPYFFTPVKTCQDGPSGLTCVVPEGHYLAVGDNRDNSDDGRYWGFVPDSHLRGKAFFIWFNWDDIASFSFKRVFSGIQ